MILRIFGSLKNVIDRQKADLGIFCVFWEKTDQRNEKTE